MTYETCDSFQVLKEQYFKPDRLKVVDYLFKINNWVKCPVSGSWRKVIKAEDEEFGNEEDNVVFIMPAGNPTGESGPNYVNYYYRVYLMAKALLQDKHVFYHEPPSLPMIDKAKVALLMASATYYQKLENKVFKLGAFSKHP